MITTRRSLLLFGGAAAIAAAAPNIKVAQAIEPEHISAFPSPHRFGIRRLRSLMTHGRSDSSVRVTAILRGRPIFDLLVNAHAFIGWRAINSMQEIVIFSNEVLTLDVQGEIKDWTIELGVTDKIDGVWKGYVETHHFPVGIRPSKIIPLEA